MPSKESEQSKEELRKRLEAVEERLARVEAIFADNLLDRQTRHVKARERDAREVLAAGDEEVMTVISPVGDGRAPDSCVGKIQGVVTFIDEPDTNFERGDRVRVALTNVSHSSANGIILGPYEGDDDPNAIDAPDQPADE